VESLSVIFAAYRILLWASRLNETAGFLNSAKMTTNIV